MTNYKSIQTLFGKSSWVLILQTSFICNLCTIKYLKKRKCTMGLESMISSIVPFTLCPTYLKLFLQVIWAISNMADKLLYSTPCSLWNSHFTYIQGVQDLNFQIQRAITLKSCISDHMLVKQKCVWEIYTFVYNKLKNMRNEFTFQTCFHGLEDKTLDIYAWESGFKTHSGVRMKIYSYQNFVFFPWLF